MRRVKSSSKIKRLRSWISWFVSKYPQKCCFCGEIIDSFKITKGDYSDEVTVHHSDRDRSNNHPSNLMICHRGCHISYHKNMRNNRIAS